MIDLIPPGDPGTFPTGVAYSVNDSGQTVGYITSDQGIAPQAFVRATDTSLQLIGTLGGADSRARRINNSGKVTGYAAIPGGTSHAFVWSVATGMQDIATLGAFSSGHAINDRGTITGYAAVSGQKRAFRWRPETGMVDIGTLGGIAAEGFAINNSDHIAGLAATSEGGGNLHSHAFLYDDTGMHDLGTLGGTSSQAQGINDDGWVVGNSYLAGDQPPVHGFVYDGIAMRDLNSFIDPASGWLILDAHDINNNGQIVALASRAGEPWGHAVLLTPLPEPAMMSWLVVSSLLTARRFSLAGRKSSGA